MLQSSLVVSDKGNQRLLGNRHVPIQSKHCTFCGQVIDLYALLNSNRRNGWYNVVHFWGSKETGNWLRTQFSSDQNQPFEAPTFEKDMSCLQHAELARADYRVWSAGQSAVAMRIEVLDPKKSSCINARPLHFLFTKRNLRIIDLKPHISCVLVPSALIQSSTEKILMTEHIMMSNKVPIRTLFVLTS